MMALKHHSDCKYLLVFTMQFRVLALVCSVILASLAFTAHAQDATLFFAPASGSFSVGKTFSVAVSVNSGGSPGINAAGATVNFDTAKVSVVSATRDKSIFNLWVTEPTYSNSDGTVKFDGGSPSAYTGTNGNLITITFRALAEGQTTLAFSNASVLAADGKGTNVLKNSQSAAFTIQKTVVSPTPPPPPPPPAFVGSPPIAPKIESPTHPDENTWYRDKNPKFTWTLPSGVSAVRLLIDHVATSAPTVVYNERISERQLKEWDDGTWFFHVQLKNAAGWGGVAHRKVLIDTGPPFDFTPTVMVEKQTVRLMLDAVDDISGVAYYELAIDGKGPQRVNVEDVIDKKYSLADQAPGNYSLTVAAVDRVENRKEATLQYVVTEPPAAQKPEAVQDSEENAEAGWWSALVGSPYALYAGLGMGFLLLALFTVITRSILMKKKFKREVAAAKKEADEVKVKTSNIFAALRDEVKEQMTKVAGGGTVDEKGQKEAVETLEGALEISEDLIQKEVEDVEKALEE